MRSHSPTLRRIYEVTTDLQVCQAHPQYADPNTGTTYAYCSQGCQAAEAVSQQAQYSQQQQGALPSAFVLLSTRLMHLSVTATCNYPGCTSPATLYPHGSNWNYCGQSHQLYANVSPLFLEPANLSAIQLCFGGLHLLSPG